MSDRSYEEDEQPARSPRVASETLLTAILAILVDEREHGVLRREKQERLEVLLTDAGLAPPVIAKLLNKKLNTVHVLLKRERDRRSKAMMTDRKTSAAAE